MGIIGRMGSINDRDLKQLRKELEKLNKNMDKFLQDCIKELAARLLAKVIKRTPVGDYSETYELVDDGEKKFLVMSDKLGGTLRRGWTAKSQQEAESGSGSPGNGKIQEYLAELQVSHVGENYTIEIINPVSYASYVEYGHRQKVGKYVPAIGKKLKNGWVTGRFMLRISEQEIQTMAPAILEKKIDRLLKEAFK